MSASLDLAAPKLGSGARFRKLSGALAARGASNPDALAAYIGRKRYGAKKMGKLSAGKSLANDDLGIYLADGPEPYHQDPDETVQCPSCQKYNDTDARYCDQCGAKLPPSAYADLSNPLDLAETVKDSQGLTLKCPECGHVASAGSFGVNGAALQARPAVLRTPAPGTGGARKGVPLTVRGGPGAHALANGTREALELAAGKTAARRYPVREAVDVRPDRQPDGSSVLRHRNGGAEIARIRKTPEGKWVATVGGKDLPPRNIQRTALMEAVGAYNGAVTAAARRQQDAPLQPPPQQTELMAEYGIPAMRSAAFATPTAGASDGPRMTSSAASGSGTDPDSGGSGLSPKAQAIYKKLKAKGFPDARALAFAKNSEKFGKPATAAS